MTKKAAALSCFVLETGELLSTCGLVVLEILPPRPRQQQDGATTSVRATISPGEDSQAVR